MTKIITDIQHDLFALQDPQYRDFQIPLFPTVDPDTIIGVRTPALRQYAKKIASRSNIDDFLSALPHRYFDENQLHAFIISLSKSFDTCVGAVERFLPFVDNWATCDQLSPKVFAQHRPALLPYIKRWLASDHVYTRRFAIGMLMEHYLDEDFAPEYLSWVASIRSSEYYVNMMIAWYFATALAKQYDATLPYLRDQCLSVWTHNKAIQKAIESRRINDERKAMLREMKVKEKANSRSS